MASTKQHTEKETEHFLFGTRSDMRRAPGRNVQRELKGEALDVKETIDAFEQAKGIIRKPKVDLSQYEYQNIVLDPEKENDGKLLNQLLNSDKYIITYFKDNWTPQGSYRVFVIYGKKKDQQES
jgi:hypothetical protein